MRFNILVIIIASLILIPMTQIQAAGMANARALGMAGSYTGLARGYDCPSFNPANLGFKSHQVTGLQIVGAGIAVSNNSFSLDDYNTYTGATLNDQDKQDLLDKIPDEGMELSFDAEVSALSLSMSNMAFSITAQATADINLGKAPMELLLQGNTMADTIILDGMYGAGFAVGAANFSYGQKILGIGSKELSVGANVKYLKGLGYEEVIELNGHAATLTTGFEGEGSLVARTATGGSGYGLDLGAALKLSSSVTVGATLFNAFSNITWNEETEEHRYTFYFDTLTVTEFGDDSVFVSEDTTVGIDEFSTSLPTTLKLGIAKNSGRLNWAVDWEQGFEMGAGTTTKPHISGGAEYRILSFLPLRAGFGTGGRRGTTYAGGLGLDLALCYIDVAAANYNAVIGSGGKGLNFAINTGIRF